MSPSRARPRPRQEELLAGSLARGATPLSPEERWTLAASSAMFLLVAGAMASFLPWDRTFSWWEVAMVVVVVAVASRTRFVTEAGHTSPIVLATVPALFLLPPPIVPLVTGVWVRRRLRAGCADRAHHAGTAAGHHCRTPGS